MLNVNRAGYALAITLAAFFALCSLFFVAWPQGYTAAIAMLYHGFAISQAPKAMLALGFFLGVLCTALVGFVVGSGFALVWNALSSERKTTVAPRVVRH